MNFTYNLIHQFHVTLFSFVSGVSTIKLYFTMILSTAINITTRTESYNKSNFQGINQVHLNLYRMNSNTGLMADVSSSFPLHRRNQGAKLFQISHYRSSAQSKPILKVILSCEFVPAVL